jgi:DNA-binding MarR family transcriptional regulator
VSADALARALVLLDRCSVGITEIALQSLGRDAVENRDIQVLIAIHRLGPQTPTDLGKHTGSPRSTISRGLARLESAGLVARSTDPHDGRSVRVSLTARGRRRLAGFASRLGDYFSAGDPLIKETFHVLGAPVPDAVPDRPVDPLLAAESMTRAGAAFVDEARPALAVHGVTDFADRFTLALLRLYGVQRPTQIADELLLTPSGTSGVLSRLEGAGLITRRHDLTPGDRRAVVVELTPRGQRAMDDIIDVFARHVPPITRALSLAWSSGT